MKQKNITPSEIKRAQTLADERGRIEPRADRVNYDEKKRLIVLDLRGGAILGLPVSSIRELRGVKPKELKSVRAGFDGESISLDALDIDISIAGLLRDIVGMTSAAALLGRKGGAVKSVAKASAVRENGRLGGRPRKISESADPQPLATLDLRNDKNELAGKLSLFRAVDGAWQAVVDGASAESERIREIVNSSSGTTSNNADYPNDLIRAFSANGLSCVVVTQVVTAQFQVDAKSGAISGTSSTIFKTDSSDTIARNVMAIVQHAVEEQASHELGTIDSAVEGGDPVEAAQVLGSAAVIGYTVVQRRRLLDLYKRVDLTQLPRTKRFDLLRRRLALAAEMQEYETAKEDARELLRDFATNIARSDAVAVQTVLGIYSALSDRPETALARFRELLNAEQILPEHRGWLWRNISLTLAVNDPESEKAARLSADAFLEGGDKLEAGRSLMRLHRCLKVTRPTEALSALEELVDIYAGNDFAVRALRASALHERAAWLSSISQHARALQDANAAVLLLRDFLGKERELAASLFRASFEAEFLHLPEANDLRLEAEAIAAQSNARYHGLTTRTVSLISHYDSDEAEKLVVELTEIHAYELLASVRIAQALMAPDLLFADRVEMLEECLSWSADRLHEGVRTALSNAMADLLLREGYSDRALVIYSRLADDNPMDAQVFYKQINVLWNLNRWGDAAAKVASRLRLIGEHSDLLLVYGKSLHNAGDSATAIPVLARVKANTADDTNLHKAAIHFLDLALATGVTPRTSDFKVDITAPVTLADVERALTDFKGFVSGDIRMSFWKGQQWRSSPEKLAELLLQGFFTARFDERAIVFAQVRAGAGIIDLFAQFLGGLSVVIELKMCGGGYSTSYAASGEDQLIHYMERRSNYGFLVVLDGRLENNSAPMLTEDIPPRFTIREVLIDVRPRVSKRRRAQRKAVVNEEAALPTDDRLIN